ncbi:MAG: ADP-ribosylglycohydrolase family protein, partial [Thermoleophilia bacterium]|nr:ADP-ribosylglycohydrolase family protein [Thermoleophilia bacterium]
MPAFDIETTYPLLDGPETPEGAVTPLLERAQGCLLGQLAGDSLGSLVEFRSKADIHRLYPGGIREVADGGTYNTLAGQPTDDSEMALMLARSIVRVGRYDPAEAAVAYARWFDSRPFDYGGTTAQALRPAVAALARGEDRASVAAAALSAADRDSQANGALMRVSPMGIFAHVLPASTTAALARQDAALTHPHPVCQDAGAVFVVGIAHAVATG